MLRSLYSGISGMKVNQTKLDVIGNNIANVGTTAYKAQTVKFSTSLSQTVTNASAPSNNKGGVNASQVGLGVQLRSIDSIMTNGNLQSTGRALDVAVDQGGYFIVSSGPAISGDSVIQVSHNSGSHTINATSLSTSGSSLLFSRDGSFILDQEGNLLTSDGYRIMGYSVTNDDSSQEATAKNSNNVSAAGLNFVFGPGSQLNGYKIVLGDIASGTSTTAKINKGDKTIVLNGDFSQTSNLTTTAIETALSLALSESGISQTITVTGKPTSYSGLSSEKVSGGIDATSPASVSFANLTFNFTEGSDLNNFEFELEAGTDTVTVDTASTPKKIKIGENVDATTLITTINNALQASGISTAVSSISGTFDSTKATTGVAITGGGDAVIPNSFKFFNFDLNVDPTSTTSPTALNGYTVQVGTVSSGTTLNAEVDINNKKIIVDADFVSGVLTPNQIIGAINNALSSKALGIQFSTITAGTGDTPLNPLTETESFETFGGTPVQSIGTDGVINFVDANSTVSSYDNSLKSLKIPDTVRVAGSSQELAVVSYNIEKTGVISAVLEDGSVAALGQIALASFKNQEGLTRLAGNLFSTSVNSGEAIIKAGVGTLGEDNSLAFGELVQGYVEMSNVDLAEQFTEMITATRAFQASSKMINTGDEILQDIINLKR